MFDRQPVFDSLANLRGGNAKRKTRQRSPAKRRWKGGRGLPGPWNGHELGEARQFARLTPFRQLWHIVCADQIKQLGLGKATRVVTNRFDRIGNAASFDLLLI